MKQNVFLSTIRTKMSIASWGLQPRNLTKERILTSGLTSEASTADMRTSMTELNLMFQSML